METAEYLLGKSKGKETRGPAMLCKGLAQNCSAAQRISSASRCEGDA
nr:MAG TPA: hypothetical protein [Caudoviricetes sp.]